MSNFDSSIPRQEFNLKYTSEDDLTDSDEEVFDFDSNFEEFTIRFSNALSEMIAHEEENDIEIEVYKGEYDSDIEEELGQVNVEQNFDNNQEERDEIIPNDEPINQKYNALSSCVIIDNIHDQDTVQEVNNDHLKLGVCDSHFLYDQNQIHDPKEKVLKEFTDAIVQHRRCIGCKRIYNFFSRGEGCRTHSWLINERNIQVPCNGAIHCNALRNSFISKPAFNETKKPRFVCCACYERLGGHIHKRTGRDEETKKEDILRSLVKVILPFIPTSTKTTSLTLNNFKSDETPSLFILQILFLDIPISNSKECDNIDCEKFGREFGIKLWKSCEVINKKKDSLNSPESLLEYFHAFPDFITAFFQGLLIEIFNRKLAISNRKKKQREQKNKTLPENIIIKMVTFFTSVLVSIAFPSCGIWLTNVLSSLARKPKLLSSLHRLFTIWNVIGHSERHERNLEKDSTIPNNLASRQEEIITLDENYATNIFENIEYNRNFDAETIKKEILAEFEHGCKGPSPHVVILEPADNPNSDQAILEAANMYKADFNLQENGYLDIVADEAIFRQLMRCQAQFPQLRLLLGQWHTSKDFCSVLIVLFSSYGLLNFARKLGVRFLDKFEAAVDYRTTSRVLDLLWLAVGVAVNIFAKKKIFLFWYLYYQWAGIWKVHRIGMRIGNHNLQRDAFSAASPLFPSAGKFNYAVAIAQHLSTLTKYPRLNEILQYVGAFRIPKNTDNRNEDQKPVCFGFDEALETFGVHFIKQNITGNVIDEAKLKASIKAAQSERDRIDLLLSEYLDDTSISQSERAINSRWEVLWKLIEDLVIVFDMVDPLSHEIFKDLEPPELHKEDVIKIEPRNAKGRRALEIRRTRYKDYAEKKRTGRETRRRQKHDKEISQPEPQVDNQESKKRRKILPHEEQILGRLLDYNDKIPAHVYDEILQQLGTEWDKKRVYSWWNYRVNKNN
ncbi:hypothetical protein GLOIN_2v1793246 [Rhizophagus irregularis DAOM 181602=DAOM 197198]|nr:hypothetical protein GLOIN_2v1793246 [Rhizophagus irregularis DAOM 181602=DAOM 197198]